MNSGQADAHTGRERTRLDRIGPVTEKGKVETEKRHGRRGMSINYLLWGGRDGKVEGLIVISFMFSDNYAACCSVAPWHGV